MTIDVNRAAEVWPAPARAWAMVMLLVAAYATAFVDRQILTLLVEPVKRDLAITDTQFSLLSGLAFTFFYTIMGIPFAWLADRGSRRNLIAATLGGLVALYALRPRVVFNAVKAALRQRAALSRKSVRVGDIVWPYLEGGKATAEPIVLVHGFGGDKDNWTLYAPHLTPHQRVICPDLPGFGENDRSVDRDYRMQAQAQRLREFLDALGVDRCHLAGNSMGGFIALQFALDYPQRLASLTLLDNAGVAGTGVSDLQRSIKQGSNPLELKTMADVDRMLAFVYRKPPFMPRQFKRVLLDDALANAQVLEKVFWSLAKEGITGVLNPRLGEVQVPTLIVWGRHDQLIDVSVVDELRSGIANSVAVIFEHVGHVPMLEAPRETARHHLALVARASGEAGTRQLL